MQRFFRMLIPIGMGLALYMAYTGVRVQIYIANGNRLAHDTVLYERNSGTKKFLVLGDSLAYGVGTTTPESSFAGQIAQMYPDAQIVNKAEIGLDVEGLSQKMDQYAGHTYDKTFIIVGGNDIARYGVDIDNSVLLLESIYASASKFSNDVYVYTTIRFSEVSALPLPVRWYYQERSEKYRQAIFSTASRYQNVIVVDSFHISRDEYSNYQASDGFHLNDAGIRRLVDLTFSTAAL